ncbi:CYTH and CHAD domain-containing protein [Nocardia jinanensis]|uniref:CHAD domain-containing protein n=1 Tax=Nocardia jinanensis TaxID=382504 RepID=A0A917RRV7_9NOCA|nr:CYTH and CHAD domain-containing protein [Nocardia jinanensis]GGL24515.1 CHAD domain-containing protein [Nocardia jinanensis]
MVSTQRERVDKYEVDRDFTLPDLAWSVPAGGRIETGSATTLTRVYYDTDERDLLRQHLTLRRRAGDTDTGWQLTVPADKARTEMSLPSTDEDTVPDELAALIRGIALGKPLHQAAVLSTVRRTQRLLDRHDHLLAEVADDLVHATVAGDVVVVSEWREVEIELGERAEKSRAAKVLTKVGKHLTEAGARPSPHASGLGRALAGNHPPAADTRATAEQALTEYLDTQVQAIVAGDVWLRRGLDPIHSTRVGIRRLRSTLRVFGELFGTEARTRLDAELSWYAGALGEVRDRQVQRKRFAEKVAALPDELVMGPVAARIENDLLAEQHHHLEHVMEILDSDRYRELMATLAQWRTGPPFIAPADPRFIRKVTRKAGRKANKRLTAAVTDTDDTALHRARKAAKRARYAAELARPVLGKKKAEKKAAEYKKIQTVLGEHQDSVVATETLRALGARAGTTPGENGFAFGLLYGLERQAAQRARAHAARLAV